MCVRIMHVSDLRFCIAAELKDLNKYLTEILKISYQLVDLANILHDG